MPNGTAERVNVNGEVEFFDIQLDLDDESRQQFEADPEGTIHDFLQSLGHVVNAVTLFIGASDAIAAGMRLRFLHVLAPPEHASSWVTVER